MFISLSLLTSSSILCQSNSIAYTVDHYHLYILRSYHSSTFGLARSIFISIVLSQGRVPTDQQTQNCFISAPPPPLTFRPFLGIFFSWLSLTRQSCSVAFLVNHFFFSSIQCFPNLGWAELFLIIILNSGSKGVVSRPVTLASHENLLEM